MFDDDGGFMRRETARDTCPDWQVCDWCDQSIEDSADELWDLETGNVFCCDECQYQEMLSRDDE